ncbi:MAG: 1-aminocyclopropane-1-carboxylate deaminase/D-cysteine desulfhydrase, partial [Chitinophagaceae bacterium]
MDITERLQWLEALAEKNIDTQKVELDICIKHNVKWDVLRTDLIHPICSGNKFFKLKYYLTEAIRTQKKIIATYGGPWSNHLVATAFAAKYCGLKSIGYIRGENPAHYSQTIIDCREQGMEIHFLNRNDYDNIKYNDHSTHDTLIIPQGGYGPKGMQGASEMLEYTNAGSYSHIICAVGSGTMYAGLCQAASILTTPIGLTVHTDDQIEYEIKHLLSLNHQNKHQQIELHHDQMGGFAKVNLQVIEFMNEFYQKTGIPTDFVYTGRLMKWIHDSINSGQIPSGSHILSIHSGGLQGNISL